MPATRSPRSARPWRWLIATAIACLFAFACWKGWTAWRTADLRTRLRAAAGRSDAEQAGRLISRLAWYDPDDRTILNIKVQAALKRGELAEAAEWLARVPSSEAGAAEVRLQQGRLLLQAFRPREAEAALRECLALDPANDSARLTLIAIFALQHRARDYDDEAWRLLDQGGEPIKALRLLAQAAPTIPPDTFTRTADIGDVLRQCLAADPDDPYTQIALGRFERERGAIDEALRLIEPCLKIEAVYPDASIEWALCLLDEGALEELRPYFEGPAESVRELAPFRFLRGEWYRRQGQLDRAIDDYRVATRLDPRFAEAHYRLGLALPKDDPGAARLLEIPRKARELKDAVTDVSDSSRNASQLARIGRLCAEIGRLREARAWLNLALKYDPNSAAIRDDLRALDASEPLADRRD